MPQPPFQYKIEGTAAITVFSGATSHTKQALNDPFRAGDSGTTIERSLNMAANAASHPRPRYIRAVWSSRKTHGNDLEHGMSCYCAHALLPMIGDAVKGAEEELYVTWRTIPKGWDVRSSRLWRRGEGICKLVHFL